MLSNPESTSLTDSVTRRIVGPLTKVCTIKSVHTMYAGHAEDICRGLSRSDFDVVIVVGGDGTVNEAVNGLLGHDPDHRPGPGDIPALAVVPTGSANVFARALGFPNDPEPAAKQLASLIASRSVRRLPLGRVENRWFCVNTGIGLDANVIDKMERLRKRGMIATPGAYLVLGLKAWAEVVKRRPTISFRAHSGEKTTHGEHLPLVMVSNTNPWTYAGPLPVILNPSAAVDNGLSLYGLRDIDGPGGAAALLHALGIGQRRWSLMRVDFREIRVDDIDRLVLTSQEPLKWQVDGESAGKSKKLELVSCAEVIDVVSPSDNGK